MEEKKNWWKNLSLFEKISIILIPILLFVIIITAIIIANKNDAINELKRKNDEITSTSIVCFENINFESEIVDILK